jgi:hypothetical protein
MRMLIKLSIFKYSAAMARRVAKRSGERAMASMKSASFSLNDVRP